MRKKARRTKTLKDKDRRQWSGEQSETKQEKQQRRGDPLTEISPYHIDLRSIRHTMGGGRRCRSSKRTDGKAHDGYAQDDAKHYSDALERNGQLNGTGDSDRKTFVRGIK